MSAAATSQVFVYWQPGCTSCLRTKEFLTRHGVAFASRNILADPNAIGELARFGLRSVPYVIKGDRYANGQALAEVAALVGIDLGSINRLPPAELKPRIDRIIDAAGRTLQQIPRDHLDDQLPGRPRSYLQLTYHLFNVVDAFLEHEQGIRLEFASYMREPAPGTMTSGDVQAYGRDVKHRLHAWWLGQGQAVDWTAKANVYYGDVDVHEFFERTTWHAGQHTRQLMWVVSDRLVITPDQPLHASIWQGLPMPENVWDPA
jgi:glutaredoxin